MSSARKTSPARSQDGRNIHKRPKPTQTRRSRSIDSPAHSNASGRLTIPIEEYRSNMGSLGLSPLVRKSILTDNTAIDEPRRQSWWQRLDENSTDFMDIMESNKPVEQNNNIMEEFDIEILSQENKNFTLDLPESSNSESINSIVLPQRKLFTEKEHRPQQKFGLINNKRDTLAKINNPVKDVNVPQKQLFQNTSRSKPYFPAALLASPNNTTGDKTLAVEPKVRKLFGNRQGAKRKNMFANYNTLAKINNPVKDVNVPQKQLFQNTSRSKPDFPAALLASPNNTTGDKTLAVEPKVRKLFGNRQGAKRKNMFANYNTLAKINNPVKDVNVPQKQLFQNTSRSKPDFPAALLASPNKTTGDKSLAVEPKVRNLFGNHQGVKRKNMFANYNFIESENESDISEIQPKVFGFQRVLDAKRVSSLREHSPTSSRNTTDMELDDWKQLPSSTMVENQLDDMITDAQSSKRGRLRKLTEDKESEVGNSNASNKTKTSNKSTASKSKFEKNKENSLSNKSVTSTIKNQIKEGSEKDKTELKADKNKHKQTEELHHAEIENNIHLENENEQDVVNDEQNENAAIKNKQACLVENEQEIESNEQFESTENENKQENSKQNESLDVQDESHENNKTAESEEDQQVASDQEIENNQQNETHAEENDSKDNTQVESIQENNDDEMASEHEVENEQIESDQEVSNYQKQGDQEVENDQMESKDVNQQIDSDEEPENEEIESDQEVESEQIESDQEVESEQIESDQEVENDQQNETYEEENDSEDNTQVESEQENNDEEMESDQEVENEQIENPEVNDQLDDQEIDNDQNMEEIGGTPNVSHDTTGRNRQKDQSPEVVLDNDANHRDSFSICGRNTTVRKSKSLIKDFQIRQSLIPVIESTGFSDGPNLPVRESTGFSDGIINSSAEGSGWDSHRTTRKTLRQTFGKDFTPRKSLRTLVMEKSAKRQTLNQPNVITALPQVNYTEMPEHSARFEANEESDHEVSIRTRQTNLEKFLEKVKKKNMEEQLRIEEKVRNSLKAPSRACDNPFLMPNPMVPRRKIIKQSKPKANRIRSRIPLESLPEEFIEDMKYKPPKRFHPRDASWTTNRLYKYLETKLEPRYHYKKRVRAEKLVETLYDFTKSLKRRHTATADSIDVLKQEMARLNIVKTHHEFYLFFYEFMPREVIIKVVPDVMNKIPVPRDVFGDIIKNPV